SLARVLRASDLPTLAGAFVGDVVTQDVPVVEGELLGQSVDRKGAGFGGVVASAGLALGPADVDGRDGVTARIARGVGVGRTARSSRPRDRSLLSPRGCR